MSIAPEEGYDADLGTGFSTLQLHHGHKLDTDNRARAPPVFLSTSFCFKDAGHGGKLFGLAELGPIYTRLMNPTTHVLEYRLAKLEGAKCPLHGDFDNSATLPSAIVVSSGQSAQLHAILTFCQAGDNIIASGELYGGTFSQFRYTFAQMGITVKFFNICNPDEIDALVDENTKAIYCETISNPSFNVPDFEEVSKKCKQFEVPFVIDNTFGMSGYTCRPFKFGADIITASCTKWIGGHGTTIGGVVIDGSTFNWGVTKKDGSLKFPLIAGDQPSYHNLNFWNHPIFGGAEGTNKFNMTFALCVRVKTLRDLGGCQNPLGSFQLLQGVETLSLRGKAHSDNANKLAQYLNEHKDVDFVSHLSLPSHASHDKAKKYFRPGCFGAVLSFGLKGSPEEAKARGEKFINSVKLASHLANVGDAKTLVIHPASTTHQQLSAEEQIAAGVKPALVRVSVGFEDIEDIIADFAQAITAAMA